MDSIAIFLGAVVAHLLDPIALIGYVAAGTLVRSYLLAVLIGVVWRFAAHLLIAMLLNEQGPFYLPAYSVAAMIAGAIAATSAVFLIARFSPAPRGSSADMSEPVPNSDSGPALPPRDQGSVVASWLGHISSWPALLRLAVAGSVAWVMVVLLYVWAFEPFAYFISERDLWRILKIVLFGPLTILVLALLVAVLRRD